MKAWDTAYPGSMNARLEGDFILRYDTISLAEALAEAIARRDHDLEDFRDQINAFAELLPGTYYMDPPDGGDVPMLEQFRRMAEDAAKWRGQVEKQREVKTPNV